MDPGFAEGEEKIMPRRRFRLQYRAIWLGVGAVALVGWASERRPVLTGTTICDVTFVVSNGGDSDARVYFDRSQVRTEAESIPVLLRKWRPLNSMQNYRIAPNTTIHAPYADAGDCSAKRTWKIAYLTGSSERVKQFSTDGDRVIDWGDIQSW